MKKEESTDRAQFSSSIAIFFATLSSAVGLGNIWMFPYKIGENGGGSFLFLYLICVLLVGMPLLIFEFYMGRRARKNVVGAFGKLSGSKKWEKVGIVSCIGSFCQLFFYTTVSGWVYSYVFKGLRGDFADIASNSTKAQFSVAINTPGWAIFWQVFVVLVVTGILLMGVKNGIEKITKTLMPVLFGLIVFCAIKALMLPNAFEGVKTLFCIDWSKITIAAVSAALGLSFFKLAIGSGAMVTYGSYFTKETNIISTTVKLIIADTIVSILVALIIFPALASFNQPMDQGKELLFVLMPMVFSKMAFGKVLLVVFFILTAIAATCSMLAVFEVPVAYFSEEKNMSRTKAVLLSAFVVISFGMIASLSASPEGLLMQRLKIGFFDVFDFVSTNLMFPIAGLCTAIFIVYFAKKDDIYDELTNKGELKNRGLIDKFYCVLKYITPVLLTIVLVMGLVEKIKKGF